MPSPSAPRKVAFSAKQKRAQLLEKRAIKRGDLPAPEVDSKKARGRGRLAKSMDTDAAIRTRMLISSFLKPSAEFLEASKNAAATEPLVRPIPGSSKVLGLESRDQELTCPRRPKWRYGMSKKEVERNEEGLFTKWIAQTDKTIDTWRESNALPVSSADSESKILPAPTYYERNLEVWRQLWRVCELSSILMLLLDARCPPLHYPPSLDSYIKSLRPARQVILVLTKIDMVGEERAFAWKSWLKEKYGDVGAGVQVVGTQSYQQTSYGEGQGSRVKYQPHLPTNLLEDLRVALKTAHSALVEPPAKVKEDPEKLANWKPAVRAHVDWDVMEHHGDKGAATTAEVPMAEEPEPEDEIRPAEATGEEEEDSPSKEYLENRYLTIGLIGQPNVGKSSLLNAIFGEHKVKTSRTPGKTKHFQTLFLTPEIRLVDCPGLVFPALVPMELQVLSNILPIAQIPALPACIHYAGNLMPIESIFGVDRSMLEEEAPVEDKRTWREGMRPSKPVPPPKEERWTAVQVMSAYATKRGWQTAHTGWPDSMRGGNAMMRSIVEGRVPWAFWPPGSNPPVDDLGIWVEGQLEHHDEIDARSDGDNRGGLGSDGDTLSTQGSLSEAEEVEEDGGGEMEDKSVAKATIGRFAALGVADESEGEDDDAH